MASPAQSERGEEFSVFMLHVSGLQHVHVACERVQHVHAACEWVAACSCCM